MGGGPTPKTLTKAEQSELMEEEDALAQARDAEQRKYLKESEERRRVMEENLRMRKSLEERDRVRKLQAMEEEGEDVVASDIQRQRKDVDQRRAAMWSGVGLNAPVTRSDKIRPQ
jgi:glycerol-3-phosphate cytidylyltransferase-like family protein